MLQSATRWELKPHQNAKALKAMTQPLLSASAKLLLNVAICNRVNAQSHTLETWWKSLQSDVT
jgi:hypothetical protein